jgi:hypothetical protein
MNALSLTVLLTAGAAGADPFFPPTADPPARPAAFDVPTGAPPTALPPATAPGAMPGGVPAVAGNPPPAMGELAAAPVRGLFQSDHEFDGFVGPVSNPILNKDPRSNSYARILFVNNNFPGGSPLGGGDARIYALQTNLALTDRLSVIADKDGVAHIAAGNLRSQTGLLNLSAGLKYTFYRDVETQTLAAAGFLYEIPSGEAKAFQSHGSGSFAPFVTVGQQFFDYWHYLQTTGYYFPLNAPQGSSFFWNSFHVDRQLFGWFYPLAEVNWFWYTAGGNLQPTAPGEGDGLLNFGTRGQSGAQLVTGALGAKAVLSKNYTLGFAYEIPLTQRHDILNQRLTVELIARY